MSNSPEKKDRGYPVSLYDSEVSVQLEGNEKRKDRQSLVVLTGPTAVGKTALSISLAKAIGGEIISADSMQVYRGMDIGSAKIRLEEMQDIPHYLIDVLDPHDSFDIVQFQTMAKKAMEKIRANGHIPILVGGTGFYIQSVVYDIDFTENDGDTAYREMLEKDPDPVKLHAMLEEVDPESARMIHPNNIKRTIRALEFYHQTGRRISDHNALERSKESPYNFAYFVLNDEREKVYARINERVDVMMRDGLEEEVLSLKNAGLTEDMVSMQGLGYAEMLQYLSGEYSRDEAVRLIKRNTRHFAKRQITWFKREKEVIWLDRGRFDNDEAKILEEMLSVLKEKNIIQK